MKLLSTTFEQNRYNSRISTYEEYFCGSKKVHKSGKKSRVIFIKGLGCQEALGMESGAITDIQVSSSSLTSNTPDYSKTATYGRLHSTSAGWTTDYQNSWLHVDLNSVYGVTRVATQGDGVRHSWVTKYKLQYQNDTESFHYYKEPGQNTHKVKLTSPQTD